MNNGYTFREQVGESTRVNVVDYLTRKYHHRTGADWKHALELGQVFVDGEPASPSDTVGAGQVLEWRRPPWEEPSVPLSYAILYRDDDLLAVAKPSGLPTLPSGGRFHDHTLLFQVRKRFRSASPLHRLGTATSGVILFGLTKRARSSVSEAFRMRTIKRSYLALVNGTPPDRLVIDQPIGQSSHALIGQVAAAASNGRFARTRIQTIWRGETESIVEAHIDTGRPHQIRIHLSHAGHPLVGDRLYRKGGVPERGSRTLPSDGGYHLHSRSLLFAHPAHGGSVEIMCPTPPALRWDHRKTALIDILTADQPRISMTQADG